MTCADDAMRGPGRAGLSLIEVLVVIAILTVAAGLLLVALQRGRTGVVRPECQNNLRQIGLALHSYESAHGSLPDGNVIENVCCETRQSKTKQNWAISILPFLGENALFAQYRPGDYCEDQSEAFRTALVKSYACPADPNATAVGPPATGGRTDLLLMPSSYRGNSGRGTDDGDRFFTQPEEAEMLRGKGKWSWRGPLHTAYSSDGAKMIPLGAEKLAAVPDGASNTFLVGEYTNTTVPTRRAFWAYSYGQYPLSAAVPYPQILSSSFEACSESPDRTFDVDACKHGWGSLHEGGLNFLLCDGSARFVSQKIDMQVFCKLATIAGGETVDGGF